LQTIAQEVLILHQQNSIPIENVAVFNKNLTRVVYSNNQGVADLSQFSKSDSVFFKHPSIEQIGLSFQDIREMNFVLQIDKRNIIMDDIVVTASRWAEKKREVPFMTDVIRMSDSKVAILQTSSDILTSTGNLMVQKSQGGAGSPVIRGFEANRLLLVVDGVRMNNAIYRSGHLQNSMSLDLGGLDRIEVIYGPSSVIYGSDALGGVIHYYTKSPKLDDKKFLQVGADAAAQFSSANNAKIYHLGLHAGFKKIAFYSSFTGSYFGDIRMGKNRNGFPQNHGKVFSQIKQGMLIDSLVSSNDPETQPATGYQQYDMTHKALIQLSQKLKLIGNVQYSTSSRINRFDELYNFQDDKPGFASWYYGPQNRFFSSLRLISDGKTRLFSDFSVILAYQKIDEDRINRKFNRRNELHQEEDVKVYSLNLDFRKSFSGNQKLEYGFEANYNDVQSDGYNIDIRTNDRTEALSRYPDMGSYVSALSGYAGYKWAPSEKIRVSAGARYSHSLLFSEFSNEFDMIPFSTVDISTGALTGSASLIYNPQRDLKISFIFSTGFRSPNVDDYGKVRAKDSEVTLPNNKLGPEYAKNAEIGIMKSFGTVTTGGNFYYTYLTDAIVNSFSTFNGKDSLLYNGDMYRIVTNTNSNEAFIAGFSVFLNIDVTTDLRFKNTFNYTKGKDVSNAVPLGHIPPVFGRSSVSFDKSIFITEMYVSYHGRKLAKDYSPTGEDNMNYATSDGTPSWTTWNINTSAAISKNVQLQLAIENIFDTYYRVFASGVSAPGRNFIITLKASI
jgi:hemoglobin/transferrin/lactoferrin receptor protein